MSSLLTRITDLIVLLYQWLISPLLHTLAGPGYGCRFEPTCSTYCRLALRKHGFARGFWLSLKRLSRCRPYGGSGEDPVPSQ